MLTATKIRIYPTKQQAEMLAKAFGCTRWLWNDSLNKTQKAYQETGKGLGQFDLNGLLPALKQEKPWLAETHSQVLQAVNLNLTRAFTNFFEQRAEYPSFKSKHGKQSVQYPQGVKIVEDRKLYLPKIGHVKAKVHRRITGKLKTVTISLNKTGRYFASVLTETEAAPPEVSLNGKVLGIDVGLNDIAVTSDGLKTGNPRFLKRAEKNLKRKQQKLSRKKNKSSGRNKARLLVARAHEHASNARKDFLHKLSRQLVDENQVIAVEDLNIKGMIGMRGKPPRSGGGRIARMP